MYTYKKKNSFIPQYHVSKMHLSYMPPIQRLAVHHPDDYANYVSSAFNRLKALSIPDTSIDTIMSNFKSNLVRHHIIPRELCETNYTGTDLDMDSVNVIYLPSTLALSYLLGRPAHHGSHPQYNQQVYANIQSKLGRFHSVSNLIASTIYNFPSSYATRIINDEIDLRYGELTAANKVNIVLN